MHVLCIRIQHCDVLNGYEAGRWDCSRMGCLIESYLSHTEIMLHRLNLKSPCLLLVASALASSRSVYFERTPQ